MHTVTNRFVSMEHVCLCGGAGVVASEYHSKINIKIIKDLNHNGYVKRGLISCGEENIDPRKIWDQPGFEPMSMATYQNTGTAGEEHST